MSTYGPTWTVLLAALVVFTAAVCVLVGRWDERRNTNGENQ